MYRKSFSQKAAGVFEIVGYLLLIPSFLGLFYSLFFIVLFPFTILAFSLGTILLIDYSKHSRGTLDEEKIIPLWYKTLIFNMLPLLPVIYLVIVKSSDFDYLNCQRDVSFFTLFFMFLVLWWIIAVSLSITAIYTELTDPLS